MMVRSGMLSRIYELMDKYHLSGYRLNGAAATQVEATPKHYVLRLGGLPQLPFFIELAKLTEVPLETIRTEEEDNGPGCDTCGYGGGVEYNVYVPRREQ